MHAELRIGRGFVMIGPRHTPRHGFLTPQEAGGINTGAVYIAHPDPDGLFERARSERAEILAAPHDTDWGSRDLTVRDPEGYVWQIGTYHPTRAIPSDISEPEVFEALRYERAPDAIAWLGDAFGLDEPRVVAQDGERVAHALLRFRSSLLLVSSARADDPLAIKPPHQAHGAHTQVVYCVTEDPRAHHARARAAGAQILVAPIVMPWGAEMYLARDPEGYVWCFAD